jgi:hypothetical protein
MISIQITYLAACESQTVLEVSRVLDENSLVDSEHLTLACDSEFCGRVVDGERRK